MQGIPVLFARQRPAGALDRGSAGASDAMIGGEGISRRQLEIRVQKDSLLVKNIGRCPLRINGVAVSKGLVRPRDTVHLGNQLILYCCWRPLELPPLQAYPAERAPRFGEPDQDGLIGESPAIWALRERLARAASTHQPVGVKGACRLAREQAERALTALQSALAAEPSAGNHTSQGRAAAGLAPVQLQLAGNRYPHFALDPGGHAGVAVTDPGFQEVEVPDLNERPEDIPLILHHMLREHAQEAEQDLSPYFWMGLPRLHPSLIETLLHQHYTHHIAEMMEFVARSLRRAASGGSDLDPLPLQRSRRKLTSEGQLPGRQRQPAPSAGAPAPQPVAPRSKGVFPPPPPPPPPMTTADSLRASTQAMLLREGLSIPIEWASPRGVPRNRG